MTGIPGARAVHFEGTNHLVGVWVWAGPGPAIGIWSSILKKGQPHCQRCTSGSKTAQCRIAIQAQFGNLSKSLGSAHNTRSGPHRWFNSLSSSECVANLNELLECRVGTVIVWYGPELGLACTVSRRLGSPFSESGEPISHKHIYDSVGPFAHLRRERIYVGEDLKNQFSWQVEEGEHDEAAGVAPNGENTG
ncbi:hypothetical protein FA13DRAFT_1723185 [Coprinellus micaceus]|uniref:Uncharacterized protein n=1 Tax=Coprinellus micaceus TaxID=71717 RepID=A0A4Y7R8U1_COPMI|nr:hypothetical protein FA13DRAFT_1723185 [Coprinellus micaceus]